MRVSIFHSLTAVADFVLDCDSGMIAFLSVKLHSQRGTHTLTIMDVVDAVVHMAMVVDVVRDVAVAVVWETKPPIARIPTCIICDSRSIINESVFLVIDILIAEKIDLIVRVLAAIGIGCGINCCYIMSSYK